MRYEIVLPEERETKKRKAILFFFISALLHVGILMLVGNQLASALREARLREIELMEEQLKKKKHISPKAVKKLEEKKKEEKKPLKPKLSTNLPNLHLKIGGPKLKVNVPENLKLKIAQTKIMADQWRQKSIDIDKLNELPDVQAKIDIENLEQGLDASAADVVVPLNPNGQSTSEILALDAVPAVSLGGAGIEGSEGGGLGLGGGDGGGGGITLGGGDELASAAPPTHLTVKKACNDVDVGPAAASTKSPMQLTGQVANRAILSKVPPKYPARAKREGWSGVVVLKFNVTESGSVTDINIVRSSSYPELDNAARNALRQWKFGAKPNSGKEWGQLTVRFALI